MPPKRCDMCTHRLGSQRCHRRVCGTFQRELNWGGARFQEACEGGSERSTGHPWQAWMPGPLAGASGPLPPNTSMAGGLCRTLCYPPPQRRMLPQARDGSCPFPGPCGLRTKGGQPQQAPGGITVAATSGNPARKPPPVTPQVTPPGHFPADALSFS